MFPKSLYPLVLLGLSATLEPRLAHAQSGVSPLSQEEDRRRALYQLGKDAIKAQRWADAKTRLSNAWTIRPSYDVALLLSQAEFNLGHFAESAQYLAYYFRNVSAKENENNLANARQALEAAKAKVGSVQVAAPRGAEILVDGKVLGTAPLDTNAFVAPGKRVFEARLGDAKALQEVQAVAGQEQQIALELDRPMAAASTATVGAGLPEESTAAAPAAVAKRPLTPVYIGAGVAAVGLGIGIGFALAASSDRDEIDALKRTNGASGCKDGSGLSSDCVAQGDAVAARDRHLTYEMVGFSLAGVAAVGTLTYLLWPQPRAVSGATSKAIRVSGGASPGGGGVWLSGNF